MGLIVKREIAIKRNCFYLLCIFLFHEVISFESRPSRIMLGHGADHTCELAHDIGFVICCKKTVA